MVQSEVAEQEVQRQIYQQKTAASKGPTAAQLLEQELQTMRESQQEKKKESIADNSDAQSRQISSEVLKPKQDASNDISRETGDGDPNTCDDSTLVHAAHATSQEDNLQSTTAVSPASDMRRKSSSETDTAVADGGGSVAGRCSADAPNLSNKIEGVERSNGAITSNCEDNTDCTEANSGATQGHKKENSKILSSDFLLADHSQI